MESNLFEDNIKWGKTRLKWAKRGKNVRKSSIFALDNLLILSISLVRRYSV
jgi:hypothetical protein